MALITAERLHRWKCLFCGSKDKNIMSVKLPIEKSVTTSTDPNNYTEGVKIVTCSQCGKTEIFAHSALAMMGVLTGKTVTIEESEEFVNKVHEMNHIDPKINPHAIHGPKINNHENT